MDDCLLGTVYVWRRRKDRFGTDPIVGVCLMALVGDRLRLSALHWPVGLTLMLLLLMKYIYKSVIYLLLSDFCLLSA